MGGGVASRFTVSSCIDDILPLEECLIGADRPSGFGNDLSLSGEELDIPVPLSSLRQIELKLPRKPQGTLSLELW